MRFNRQFRASLCFGLILPAWLLSSALQQQPETPQSRGRQIYVRGFGSAGSVIKAKLGQDGTEIPASVLPCSSCHGLDGQGKPEGGVFPPPIRWIDLTRSYQTKLPNNRKHPAYTESLLVRAVTLGIDSAGNTLDNAMPRFQLSQQNAKDLIAWSKMLGASDPGLNDSSIEVGVFLPAESRFAAINSASRESLDAYFDEVNHDGGLYISQIILHYGNASEPPATFDSAFNEFLSTAPPFALLDSYIAGAEKTAGKILQENGLPLIGAFSLYPGPRDFNPNIFYLNSGVPEQALALAGYAEQKIFSKSSQGVVLCGDKGPAREVADSILQRHNKLRWRLDVLPDEVNAPDELSARLKRSGTSVFLLLCSPATMEQVLMAAGSQPDWDPIFLVPGSLATEPVFRAAATLKRGVVFAVSPSPSDTTSEGLAAYYRLGRVHGLRSDHLAARLSALAEASILHEALIRAGHELTREKLITALESMYDFQTGFAGAISFGPTRRIGNQKVTLTRLDNETGHLQPLP